MEYYRPPWVLRAVRPTAPPRRPADSRDEHSRHGGRPRGGVTDAGRLIAPLQIATAVDFAYYLVHPKAKGRLPQVKAFVTWISAEAAAHEAALAAMDNGAGI